ncbi:short-chain dehydrogenase/reductase SDR [Rhodoferax ferrireducens T118]|uniref:Short-chain dehydrogenase/reductase SDR n=1 Tax=Albidiferax ferrireducens (strain ATCC BAA-621 / DSM 15236 / T118) TaxID=338969 RepID=Q21TR6_ALBFT|nr:SDR family oxidoreductase [Rhodoferax ferrireducens]ABD70837.1 short-chain dehydrogenase/reductase SDR [Rhodoferax ferrireducens T118]
MCQGRLEGKTVLITAAAQGIGRASALACAAEGARVIATDINQQFLDSLAAEHAGIQVAQLDVRNDAAVTALAARTPALDALFNCAGMVANGSMLECSEADWDLSFDLNVKSMFRMTRAFMPAMLAKAQAENTSVSIINMASMASSIKGFANRCAYGATKAAVIGLTKSLAADYVKAGLRANALCPGTVDTPSLRGRIANAADPVQAEKDFIARQPMGRLATVTDITPMVVFLASDESRFVTGQTLLVDGGVTI